MVDGSGLWEAWLALGFRAKGDGVRVDWLVGGHSLGVGDGARFWQRNKAGEGFALGTAACIHAKESQSASCCNPEPSRSNVNKIL